MWNVGKKQNDLFFFKEYNCPKTEFNHLKMKQERTAKDSFFLSNKTTNTESINTEAKKHGFMDLILKEKSHIPEPWRYDCSKEYASKFNPDLTHKLRGIQSFLQKKKWLGEVLDQNIKFETLLTNQRDFKKKKDIGFHFFKNRRDLSSSPLKTSNLGPGSYFKTDNLILSKSKKKKKKLSPPKFSTPVKNIKANTFMFF